MKNKEVNDLIKDCTSKMSIDIDGLPKDKAILIANDIGKILLKHRLKFTYGGIGEGFTDKICGIQFDVENSESDI